MKTTKRVLGIVLALAMVLTLALPAGAADTPHPMAPVITKEPALALSLSQRMTEAETFITVGTPFSFSAVEAELPDGVTGTLEYQWYQNSLPIVGANGPELTVSITLEDVKARIVSTFVSGASYYVEVINRYVEDGQEKTAVTTSQELYVTPCLTFEDAFRYTFWLIGENGFGTELFFVPFIFLTMPFPYIVRGMANFFNWCLDMIHKMN